MRDYEDKGSILGSLMGDAGVGRNDIVGKSSSRAYNDLMSSINDIMEDAPDTAESLKNLIDSADALYDANPAQARKVKDTLAMALEYLDMRSDEGEIEGDEDEEDKYEED